MRDGIYTLRGHHALDERAIQEAPAPLRRVMMFWGVLVLGALLVGMTVSGLVRRMRGPAENAS